MSGTSLDGVDSVIAEVADQHCQVLHQHFTPYPASLREQLLTLHHASPNELELSALSANALARLYADNITELLALSNIQAQHIQAIGCHGQTIRHRPELGFTLQIGNAALLAELTGMTTIADFRSRDIAAGGHGAPLVPAFHAAMFAHPQIHRVVLNIGGIANLSDLPPGGKVTGFDTGPGNMLMDAWIEQHQGLRYDANGQWAASGTVLPELLQTLLSHPYFQSAPPKSTGRDMFNLAWLSALLQGAYRPEDVQRTLLELSAVSIASAVSQHCATVQELYVCGGGAYNDVLMQRLQQLLQPATIQTSDVLGIAVNTMEAAAFAWLARQAFHRLPGNLPNVTGAQGPRVLGAIYAG